MLPDRAPSDFKHGPPTHAGITVPRLQFGRNKVLFARPPRILAELHGGKNPTHRVCLAEGTSTR